MYYHPQFVTNKSVTFATNVYLSFVVEVETTTVTALLF